jgi:hypothetical protein
LGGPRRIAGHERRRGVNRWIDRDGEMAEWSKAHAC